MVEREYSFIRDLKEFGFIKNGNYEHPSSETPINPEAYWVLADHFARKIQYEVEVRTFDCLFGLRDQQKLLAHIALSFLERGVDLDFEFSKEYLARQRILVVSDEFTDGEDLRQALHPLARGTFIRGIVVGVDKSEPSRIEEFTRKTKWPVWAITTSQGISTFLH